MAADFQLEFPVLVVKWTCDARIPESSHLREVTTPEFSFLGEKWCLSYNFVPATVTGDDRKSIPEMIGDSSSGLGGQHNLLLRKVSEGPHPAFDVSVRVRVGDGTERIVTEGLSCKQRIGSDDEFVGRSLWIQSDIDVKRMHPNFRENGVLHFLIELKKYNALKAKDTATQTICFIPEAFQLQCMDNLSQDFARLMVRDTDTDVEFRCEGQSFKAHGTVVCARSPVIASMLSSDKVEGKTRVIQIPDMTAEVFKIFLGYLYTGKTPELTFELARTLYESADRYAVRGLARRCSGYLVENLSEQTVWDVLVLADAHHDSGFEEEVFDYMMGRNTLKTSDRWPSFCVEHPALKDRVLDRFRY